MSFAVFVLSTGRCGTQWLAANLARACGDAVRVEHEPLDNGYSPRLMLAARRPEALPAGRAAPLLAHVEAVERELAVRPYIECGHPCWSSIPYLAERFAGRIRIVHLVRHPVRVALSWLTQNAYQRPLLPHLPEKVLLAPTDAGISLVEYGARWPQLSPFEKCLFYWAEVNGFGLARQQSLAVPWLRLEFETLFAPGPASTEAVGRLLDFLDLPRRTTLAQATGERVDCYPASLLQPPPRGALAHHPRIAQIAAALGYRLDDEQVWNASNHYFGGHNM